MNVELTTGVGVGVGVGVGAGVEGEGALLPVGGLVAEELELEVEVFEDVLVDDGEDVVLIEEEEVSIDVASELL